MDRCIVRVGRIIDHACGRRAAAKCRKCGNAACDRHLDQGTCTVCAGTWTRPIATLRLEDLDVDGHFAGAGVTDAAFDDRGGPEELHGLDS